MSPVERLSEPYEPVAAVQEVERRIAVAIRELSYLGPAVQANVVEVFARMLAQENQNFDSERFTADCTTAP